MWEVLTRDIVNRANVSDPLSQGRLENALPSILFESEREAGGHVGLVADREILCHVGKGCTMRVPPPLRGK